jgi:threonine/homoserine/homoserine lactone efflux protein
MQDYIAFAAIAALVVVSPGPATFLVLKNTPVQGRGAGLLNMAGIVAAVLSHAALSLLGVSSIILTTPIAFQLVKFLGGAYLTYLGMVAIRGAWGNIDFSAALKVRSEEVNVSAPAALAEGWFVNILNPKPSMFYLSIFPQFINPTEGLIGQGVALAGIHAAIAASWFTIVVLCIDKVRAILQQPAIWRAVKAATGVIFIGLAARLATISLPT